MSNNIKITIIGAGSAQFSAGIVRDLCVIEGMRGSHVTFMDVDLKRLNQITRLAERMAEELNVPLTFSQTTNREEALRGSDFVINTAMVGGHGWAETQRSLAESHGYYRGIQLQSFAQMVFFLDVARDMERLCPNAWLIQSANPVFEGCTLMTRQTSIKVLGLCHGHYGYQEIAKTLGLDVDKTSAQMYGFNHWIWMTDFRYKGKDAYPLLNEWIEKKSADYWADFKPAYYQTQMSPAAIHQYQLYGLVPIGDSTRLAGWWYQSDLKTKQKWYGDLGGFDSEIGWCQYLKDIEKNVAEIDAVASDSGRKVTEKFRPVQSKEQIVPIINSLVNDVEAVYQVNIPNEAHIVQGVADDLVIECPGVVNGSGIRGIQGPPLPRKIMASAMLPRWHKAELMIEAVNSADRDLVLHFLLADQRTVSLDQAENLLDAWLNHPENTHMKGYFKSKRLYKISPLTLKS